MARARVERTCEHCGKRFSARLSEVRRGWGRFCSLECSHAYSGKILKRLLPPRSEEREKKQIRSSGLVNMRIRRGRMIRPDHCGQCGKVGCVDAHHDDYAKPDQVRWLCRSCHMKTHVEERKRQSQKGAA